MTDTRETLLDTSVFLIKHFQAAGSSEKPLSFLLRFYRKNTVFVIWGTFAYLISCRELLIDENINTSHV